MHYRGYCTVESASLKRSLLSIWPPTIAFRMHEPRAPPARQMPVIPLLYQKGSPNDSLMERERRNLYVPLANCIFLHSLHIEIYSIKINIKDIPYLADVCLIFRLSDRPIWIFLWRKCRKKIIHRIFNFFFTYCIFSIELQIKML